MSCVSFKISREMMRAFEKDCKASVGSDVAFNATPTPQPKQSLDIGHDVWVGQGGVHQDGYNHREWCDRCC